MERLTEIADASLKETGIFLSKPPLNTNYRHPSPLAAQVRLRTRADSVTGGGLGR